MQARKDAMRPGCLLWLGALAVTMTVMIQMTSAYSTFCDRPENMEICWFNKINKRFLRFGRGDPFLRFGKRASDLADLQDEFLGFDQPMFQPSLYDLLALEGTASRKRRDVNSVTGKEAPALQRPARDVKDGGFLRFGRDGDYSSEDIKQEGLTSNRADVLKGENEYLRFGRVGHFPRWGKRYLRFGRVPIEDSLRFGKGSY